MKVKQLKQNNNLLRSKTVVPRNPETVAQIKPNITPREVFNEVTNER